VSEQCGCVDRFDDYDDETNRTRHFCWSWGQMCSCLLSLSFSCVHVTILISCLLHVSIKQSPSQPSPSQSRQLGVFSNGSSEDDSPQRDAGSSAIPFFNVPDTLDPKSQEQKNNSDSPDVIIPPPKKQEPNGARQKNAPLLVYQPSVKEPESSISPQPRSPGTSIKLKDGHRQVFLHPTFILKIREMCSLIYYCYYLHHTPSHVFR
jgi:hypothetical protein